MDPSHLDDATIFELALSPEAATESARRHVRECPPCRAELAGHCELVELLALASGPCAPSRELRARVEAALIAHTRVPLGERLARFFGVSIERARTLLASLAEPSTYAPGPLPGLERVSVDAGAALAGATWAGVLRMAPGVVFPAHRHEGDESLLVLAGGMRVHDGTLLEAGDELHSAPGSTHELVMLDDEPCIVAVVQYGALEFGVEL